MKTKVTYEVAKKRFEEQPRADIILVEDGFIAWKKKSKFYDLVEKDFFWSRPCDVYKNKSVHPNRKAKKREQTNIKNWGVPHAIQSQKIKNKSKKTCLEKYGVEYYLQTEDKQNKSKKTCLEKYGVEYPQQNKKIKKKIEQTCLERYGATNPFKCEEVKKKAEQTMIKKYGVKNPSQFEDFQEKKKETNLKHWGVAEPLSSKKVREKSKTTMIKKYGVEHPMESEIFKEKIRETCLQKYGTKHYFQSAFYQSPKQKKIIETKEYVIDWLSKQKEPKPTIPTINQIYSGIIEIHLKELEDYLERFRSYKSNIEMFTESLFNTKHFNRKPEKINRLYRPDFKLNEQIFLNVDGLYWHSTEQKDKQYHFGLRKEFEENELRLLQFYESELLEKTDIVKSIISNSLGKTPNKIFARKCKIQIVKQKEATTFLNSNHLMGKTLAKHIGLFYKNELVSLLSYKTKGNVCKIERFCSKIEHSVIGSFSKLLKYLENNCLNSNVTEIHNWVDLRYGTGNHLLEKEFVFKKETLGWKWTDGKTTFNRLKCRANMDDRKLSQQEYADELKWFKIYDAGQRLYVKNTKNFLTQNL